MSSATRTVRGLRAPSSSSFFVLRLRAIVFFFGAALRVRGDAVLFDGLPYQGTLPYMGGSLGYKYSAIS